MRTEEIDRVHDGLRVVLEFELAKKGMLDRQTLVARVKECIGPRLKEGLRHGRECLKAIPLIEAGPLGLEISREPVDVWALWKAHIPWHADHPDWSKAPSACDTQGTHAPDIW